MNEKTAPKHSKAPWRVQPDEHGVEHDIVAKNGYFVATVRDMATDDGQEEMANAHLIRAAPSMLVALERAREALTFARDEDRTRGGEVDLECTRALTVVDVALAEARGER